MPSVIDHKFHTHFRFLMIQFDSDNFNCYLNEILHVSNVKMKILNKYFKMHPEESVPKSVIFAYYFE